MNRRIVLLISLLLIGCHFFAKGQGTSSICPPNIGFETGTYADWVYFNGSVSTPPPVPPPTSPIYTLPLGAPIVPTRELLEGPVAGVDRYGGFPTVAPGGGSYSLRLGSDTNENVAERAVYYIDIPAGTTVYSLVYHYAAVLENPGHPAYEEPRFIVTAVDSATGDSIPCAVYTYVSGGAVPGFFPSGVASRWPMNGFDVTYKPWTYGNIKFPGENGRTVALEFTANACTLGAHFGYGYLDMTCGLFANLISCSTTTETLTAPPGFASYQWLDSVTMATSYGTTQSITVAAPTVPTTYAVILTPYVGYGCPDTLYSRLIPSDLAIRPSDDTTICSGDSASFSSGASDIDTPLSYSWAPTTGLSCPTCSSTLASPATTTAYSFTVTDPGGCSLTHIFNLTVFTTPTAITGNLNICLGGTTGLADPVTGGTWSSDNLAAATAGALSGTIYGVSVDTATIVYATGGGLCAIRAVATVNPLPPAITGSVPVCAGSTITLHDATTGGTWSTSNAAIASVGSASGVVTGVSLLGGNATITFTSASGCVTSTVVTVNPLSPIAGASPVCPGLTTAFSDPTPGGTWMSSNTAIAAVGTTGIVVGVAPAGGTAVITYTTPAGCTTTKTISVNPAPAAITGVMSVCPGTTTTLRDATTGGAWSSSNNTTASIGSGTGVVTGGVSSLVTMTFTLGSGCLTTAVVTVNPTPPAIAGPTAVCTGSVVLLSDGVTGGTWSSSSAATATAGLTTGVIGGVSTTLSSATITYTSPAGCTITTVVTVNPLPPIFIVTGGGVYCAGGAGVAVGLSGSTAGISYELLDPIAIGTVIGTGTAITFGLETAAGTYIVQATNTVTGCVSNMTGSATVSINPVPPPFIVTGGGSYCSGTTGVPIGLAGSTIGVNYQFHDGIFVGPIVPGTGAAINFGIETVGGTYTVSAVYPATGCTSTMTGSATITVLPLPPLFSVTGGGGYCAGSAGVPVGLAGSTIGIVYELFDGSTGIATTSGTGAPLAFGLETTPGSYYIVAENTATTCRDTMTGAVAVSINPLPGAITGAATVCVGATITEVDDSTGGAWASSIPANASVVSTTGVVTGVTSASTTIITYTLPTGCTATRTITVSMSPAPVTGPTSVCAGSTVTESDAVPGVVWSSGASGIAIVGSSTGVVAGLSAGVAPIIGTIPSTGCTMSALVTVNPLPGAITGITTVCTGLTTSLFDVTTGGAWSAGSFTAVATITPSTGIVSGSSGGTALITYTLPTTCAASTTVTVYPSPAAISGPPSVCQSATITLTDAVTGGTWSSSNTSVAVVTGTGMVVPGAAGTTVITYTMPGNCTSTKSIVVNPISPITGPNVVCQGLTIDLGDATLGGTWSSSSTTTATVNGAGVVGGVAPGTTIITYTTAAGCTASTTITVNLTPTPITGSPVVCVGSSVSLGDGTAGGAWSITNAAIATISGGVELWGASPGNTVITYELPTGCSVTAIVTVNPLPAGITGSASVCSGLTIALHDATTGGTWSSGATSVATVDPVSGVVTGAISGPVNIIYTISATGCTATTTIFVNHLPDPITGPASICIGYTTILDDATLPGTWSSSATSVATVGTGAGVVYGVSRGTTIITYTIPTGCVATSMVTVVPVPTGITGPPTVCEGSIVLMSVPGAPGGVWATEITAIATIGTTTGFLTGVASGTVLVSYTIGIGCNVVGSILVNALSPIFGDSVICVGESATLTDTTEDGVWGTTDPAVATILGTGFATGLYTGAGAGTAAIKYTLPTGCVAISIVTVNPLPALIGGRTNVCVASTTTLTDVTTGGAWSSGNTAIAVVNPSTGVVTGVSAGPVTISYTLAATGCPRTITVIVNALPDPISGPDYVCPGTTTLLSDAVGPGTWSSVPSSVGTIGATSGVFSGVNPGTATVTYTLPITGCFTSSFITVEPWTDPITGVNVACLGSTTALSDGSAGGVWSSSNTVVAPVGLFSGVVSGYALGTATITFTTSFGCVATTTVTVDPSPAPITGPSVVCQGSTITLSDPTPGGTWSCIPSSVATVDSVTGVVTGILGGPVMVYYTLGGVCSATALIIVNPLPGAITGGPHVCSEGTAVFSDLPTGGTWTSSNTSVASITPLGGFVTGASPGTTNVTYRLTTGCLIAEIVTVDPMPSAISGPTNVCAGSTITLTNTVGGGSWSSSSPTIATAGASTGVVTGVASGVADVSYSIGACVVSVPINVFALPTVFTVTGGGSHCAGGPGVAIGLNGSAVGVLYYLYHGVTATGTFSGTGTALNFGLQSVAGTYTVVGVSSSTSCSNTMAGSAYVSITPTVAPSVSFTDTPGITVCAGTTVTFRSVPVYGGVGATYQWTVNGVDVSAAHNYSYIPANGDVVAVAMTSDSLCPLPAVVTHSVTMTVTLPGLPEVSVETTPGDTVCQGIVVRLTALPIDGGGAPSYSWVKNGSIDGVAPIYTFVPANGDVVYCVMTSNYPCRLADSAVSSSIKMTVDTPMVPVVTINANPGTTVGIGLFDTLTASAENAGPSPSYQWVFNGLPIAGATSNTFISNNFSYPKEDSVSCIVTADDACRISAFQWVYINSVPRLGVTALNAGGDDIVVIPNPNKGQFTIKGSLGINYDEEVSLEITDMLGQTVYKSMVLALSGVINEQVTLSNGIANGMYLLNVHSQNGVKVFHMVIEQ